MTLIFEISNPPQWKPGIFHSSSMVRVYWLWFALGILRVAFKEFAETSYDWSYRDRKFNDVLREILR